MGGAVVYVGFLQHQPSLLVSTVCTRTYEYMYREGYSVV